MRLFMYSLIAVLVLIGSGASGEKDRVIKGWGTIADPEGDCQFLEQDGRLIIKVPGTIHDLVPFAPYKNNGPRVYQEVTGDFVVEVTVAPTVVPDQGTELPGRNVTFRAGTLLVWQDSNNFIRLDSAGMLKGGRTITTAYFQVFKDGKRIVHLTPSIKDEETVLRIERKGDTILASATQGRSVTKLAQQIVPMPVKVQVAVAAINASTQPLDEVFSNLKITTAPVALNIQPTSQSAVLDIKGQLTQDDGPYAAAVNKKHKLFLANLEAGRTYQIDMKSKGFDSYLFLESPEGKLLVSDDDGGGFPDARIIHKATMTGEYRIIATYFGSGGQLGEFTLTVRQTVGQPAPPSSKPVIPNTKNEESIVLNLTDRADPR